MKKKRFFVIALLVFCMASAVTVCVRPMSNKKTLSKIQLSEDRKVATGEVKCGYNCAYGKLVMVCFTASNVLVSFDN